MEGMLQDACNPVGTDLSYEALPIGARDGYSLMLREGRRLSSRCAVQVGRAPGASECPVGRRALLE